MSLHRLAAAAAVVGVCAATTAPDAHADNSISVLQFGGTDLSSTTQIGTTTSNAITLQFGSFNQASAVQTGSISPLTINSSVIGQGGSASSTNIAGAGQTGGSNTSLIGQIGTSNSATATQLGLLNGSTILQASP